MNTLSPQAERLFIRIIMKADDFGRLTGNEKLLRPMLFPLLLDQVREADLQRWLAECEKAGLIRLYKAESKRYLQIWNFQQRTRADKSKYPPPLDSDGQVAVNGPSSDGHMLTYSETETETETETDKSLRSMIVPDVLKTPEFTEAWTQWLKHRRERKPKVTPTTAEFQLKQLAKLGPSRAVNAITHSIANGWQGIFEPKNQGSKQRSAVAVREDD